MGTTCTNIQLRLEGTTLNKACKNITNVYAAFGYDPSEGSEQAEKQVIICQDNNSGTLSLYDSNHQELDGGELKEIASALSKALKNTAVFVTVYDSDSYEFIIFSNGKQIDALMTDAESHEGGLKQLKGKARIAKWSTLFRRTVTAGSIEGAVQQESSFADESVSSLCELAGIPAAAALTHFKEMESQVGSGALRLSFKKRADFEGVNAPPSQISLHFENFAADFPYHAVAPAKWPTSSGNVQEYTWPIVTTGRGFTSATVDVHLASSSPLKVGIAGSCSAMWMYNGQVVGSLHKHETQPPPVTPVADPQNNRRYIFSFPDLRIPPITPANKSRLVLFFSLVVQVIEGSDCDISVNFQPDGEREHALQLPILRLSIFEPAWRPIISGRNPRARFDPAGLPKGHLFSLEQQPRQAERQTYLLNYPAYLSSVSILAAPDSQMLIRCRELIEPWLKSMVDSPGIFTIRAEKQMTASGNITTTKERISSGELFASKIWKKLFDAKANLQTVSVQYIPEGYTNCISGLTLQISMNSGRASKRQLAKALQVMRGKTISLSGDGELSTTLHICTWIINHPDCIARAPGSIEFIGDLPEQLTPAFSLLQAWRAEWSRVPLFDRASEYSRTAYEDSSLIDWFRGIPMVTLTDEERLDAWPTMDLEVARRTGFEGWNVGINGTSMSAEWCSNVLRAVTPRMWLSESLMQQVDHAQLEEVAVVTTVGNVHRIDLKANATLEQLELALLPILPVETARFTIT